MSEAVSDALVETGKEQVVRTLLENPNAAISSLTMEYLVEQSRRIDSFHEPILNRGDLDPSLTQRMFMWVSAALRKYILDTYEMEPDMVDDLLEKAALEAIDSQSRPVGSSSKAQERERGGFRRLGGDPNRLWLAGKPQCRHLFVEWNTWSSSRGIEASTSPFSTAATSNQISHSSKKGKHSCS